MLAKTRFIASMVIFSTLPFFVRSIPVSSATLALLRAAIAAFFLLTLRFAAKSPLPLMRRGKDAGRLFLSGALLGFNWIFLFEAYKHTTVAIASLLYYFAPMIVVAASAVLFHERMGKARLFCFLGATAGLVLVIEPASLSGGISPYGVVFSLCAATIYAAIILINQRITTVGDVDRTIVQFAAAIIVLLPYLLLTEGIRLEKMYPAAWAQVAVVGLIHTGTVYLIYFSSLHHLRGQEIAVFSYIDPMLACFLSFTVLKEPTSLPQLLGGGMILGFTMLNETSVFLQRNPPRGSKMQNKFAHLRKGFQDGIPVMLGYFAVSISVGIAAHNAGLTALQATLASLLNNTSAGEYAAIALIGAGAGYLEVALITLISNARYILMSCALSQKLPPSAPLGTRMLIGFDITDEVFGLSIAVPGRLHPWYAYGLMLVSIPGWAAGTCLGVLMGNVLPALLVEALSISLYGMFIAVIIPTARSNRTVAGLIGLSMALSWLVSRVSLFSFLSSGMQIILLTVIISAGAALLFPVREVQES